ncbi:MAG: hypothetical protein Q6366_004565 [Candidatus Freyarchaeota archaeon]
MSRGALLTGMAGGIIGTITAIIGIMWSIVAYQCFTSISQAKISATIYSFIIGPWLAVPSVIQPIETHFLIFLVASIILVIFLVLTGILVGVGFYGVSTLGGGGMGVVALIFSSIGCVGAGFLIILGNMIHTTEYMLIFDFPFNPASFRFGSISVPNFQTIGTGFLILGATIIILGIANIVMRDSTTMPTASKATGIISIIGACFFLLGALNLPILYIIGFIIMLIVSILWAVVFYSSGQL